MTRKMTIQEQKDAIVEEIVLIDEICGELDDESNAHLKAKRNELFEKFKKLCSNIDFEIGYFDFYNTEIEVTAVSDRAKEYLGYGAVGCIIRASALEAWVSKLQHLGYEIK